MAGRALSDAEWAQLLAREPGAGVFAVVTTGIVCRSGCPARPLRRNVRFYFDLQLALAEGFRTCKRCKPELPQ
ncbi:Ada metal-binding domain-containing protein [Tabrizicola sp.]|uniref:Ada metal-binding domain-containing protein n=1 Tax=Tabrizicola sp. TaxID=2005166 RepID=UPI00286D6174|nr:Ada metal-binding domain-containing protein [Tabrizicola sp.]